MKFKITNITILFFLFLLLCKNENIAQRDIKSSLDVITTATPNGGKLKPAEEGPVRSALGQPKIELDSFQLSISGLVDSSFSLTWEEIQHWPPVYSDTILMYCVEGWEVWGNWKGILVKELLEKATLLKNARHVLFSCLDGYTTALLIDYIKKYDVMLAYEVNGEPLQKHDGFPLRIVAFGKYGYKWAKWVSHLEVVEESQEGYWEKFGYSDRADVPLERRRYYEGESARPLDY